MRRELETAKALADEISTFGDSWGVRSPQFEGWRDKVRALIRRVFGDGSAQEDDFDGATWISLPVSYINPDPHYAQHLQDKYGAHLPRITAFLEALVQDLELRGESMAADLEPNTVELLPFLRIFVVHDGATAARSKLQGFIRALGAEPVIAENEPSKGRSVSEKVDAILESCHYAVALATKARGRSPKQ